MSVKSIVMLVIVGILGFTILVSLWPTMQTTVADVAALTQTDIGTTILQVVAPFWPLGIAVAVGVGLLFSRKKKI